MSGDPFPGHAQMVEIFSRFEPRLQHAIVNRLGWSSLRPVQQLAGAAILDGKNTVVLAPTAGGKTEASFFPVLSQLITDPPISVGVIYISPIKALLNNQADRLGVYTEMIGLSRFVWHGDISSSHRKAFIRQPAELLMTTPESLEVMFVSRSVDEKELFKDVRVVIIDEVHAIAGADRGAHLLSVLERINAISVHDLQRIGLSATVGNPEDILNWMKGTSSREGVVVDPPKQRTKRNLRVLLRPELGQLASDAAAIARGQKSLFFCQSRKASEQVAAAMRRCGTSVYVHHSAVSKEERALAEQNFHAGGDACIVCTSTLELGIDIGDLDAVLQSNATDTVSSFMQRMGRTGRRAGRHANTTFFCEETDSVVQALAIISLAKQGFVESIKINHRSWPVLIHQLLAMALSAPVTPDAVWQHVSPLSDFRDITRAEFDALVAHLIGANAIFLLNGAIALGPAAERAFGRRNFMELFAVFSTPQSYSVVTTDQRAIGTLSQEFVDSLSDGVSSFILSGRGWSVQRINHTDRTIIVTPSSFGTRPTWGGTTPQFLSFALCQEMLALLTADSPQPLCDPVAAEHLALRRAEMQELVAPLTGGFELLDNGSIRWWTFVGGRINNTLKQALLAIGGDWKIATNNLAITISGSEQQDLFAVIDRLKDGAIWQDTALWCEVAGTLPSYRLSKFQRFMPDWVEREVLVDFLLDVDGGSKWMKCE